MSVDADITELKVDVATLKTHYEYIKAGVEKTEAAVSGLNGKFDQVLTAFREEQQRRSRMSKIWATASHVATGALTLLIVKLLNIPLSIG